MTYELCGFALVCVTAREGLYHESDQNVIMTNEMCIIASVCVTALEGQYHGSAQNVIMTNGICIFASVCATAWDGQYHESEQNVIMTNDGRSRTGFMMCYTAGRPHTPPGVWIRLKLKSKRLFYFSLVDGLVPLRWDCLRRRRARPCAGEQGCRGLFQGASPSACHLRGLSAPVGRRRSAQPH